MIALKHLCIGILYNISMVTRGSITLIILVAIALGMGVDLFGVGYNLQQTPIIMYIGDQYEKFINIMHCSAICYTK